MLLNEELNIRMNFIFNFESLILKMLVQGLDEGFWDEYGERDANCWVSEDVWEGEDPVEREEPVRIQFGDEVVTAGPH